MLESIAQTFPYLTWMTIGVVILFIPLLVISSLMATRRIDKLKRGDLLFISTGVIVLLVFIGGALIQVAYQHISDETTVQSEGILISADYAPYDEQYTVKLWDKSHTEVNLVYKANEFSFKPGASVKYTSYINYLQGQEATDLRTLSHIQYAE